MKKRGILGAIATAILLILVGVWLYYANMTVTQRSSDSSKTSQKKKSALPSKPPYVDQILSKMTLHDKVASLFILHTPGTDATTLSTYMNTYKPGGLIFMEDNIPTTLDGLRLQTNVLTTNRQLPPLLAIDEEGDTVKRLAADTYPGALTLPDRPASVTKEAFIQRSELLKSVGLNLNFGIIADVTANPHSFIFPRVLGTTPQAASERVAQAVIGSKGRSLSTIKHFPGHGETEADSHTSIPTTATTYADWKQRDALPFKAGIDAGSDMVMFGHLRYLAVDSQPASLSKKWHDIARDEMGYKGVIVTDDMLMLQDSNEVAFTDPGANAIAALQAGNDLLLYVLNHGDQVTQIDPNKLIDDIIAATTDGRMSVLDIDDHVQRVLAARHAMGQALYR